MHVCVLQIAMSEHLKTLEVYHISTIPKLRLPLDVLFAASLDRSDAENLFQHLRTQLRKPPLHSRLYHTSLDGAPCRQMLDVPFNAQQCFQGRKLDSGFLGDNSCEPLGTCRLWEAVFWTLVGNVTEHAFALPTA